MAASPPELIRATVYLVRHAECSANVSQIALEPFIDYLTDVGKTQAEILGKALKNVHFTRACASDYPRTFETAQIILRQSEVVTEANLKPEKRIRERDYTVVLGQAAATAINVVLNPMKNGTPYLKVEIPESETVQQFEDRIIDFFSELIQDCRKSTLNEESVLVLAHGLTNQRLMVLLNNRAMDFGIKNWTCNLYSEKLMRNATYHKIVLDIPRDEKAPVTAQVEHAHCREHFDKETGNDSGKNQSIKDAKNNTSLDEKQENLSKFEIEKEHYCTPV